MNNGRRHPIKVKKTAKLMRKSGLTHREISKKMGISLGSAFLWTKGIILTDDQKMAVMKRKHKVVFTPERRQKLRQAAKVNLSKFWKKPYSKKELLSKIQRFYLDKGRIPLKEELGSYWACQKRFGSWNNAVKAAGFEPNPVIFSKKSVAKDGHNCDSFAEKIIDDWLCDKKIAHNRNFKYRKTKFTADFFIAPNIIVEFFGLAGTQKLYDEVIKIKRKLSKNLSLKLIEIYPKDIKLKNRLNEIIKI